MSFLTYWYVINTLNARNIFTANMINLPRPLPLAILLPGVLRPLRERKPVQESQMRIQKRVNTAPQPGLCIRVASMDLHTVDVVRAVVQGVAPG